DWENVYCMGSCGLERDHFVSQKENNIFTDVQEVADIHEQEAEEETSNKK
ncbi:3991_t:CDS:2, partial [Ambispora gerdemannii]